MPRKNRSERQIPSSKNEEPKEQVQADQIKTTPQARQQLRERIVNLAKNPTYDGRMKRLFTLLYEMHVQAQVNLDAALNAYMAYRLVAGLANMDIEQVKERLAEQEKGKGGLNAIEAKLSDSIDVVEDEQDLRDSVEALEGAVSELHSPPSSMSKQEYANCLGSLRRIKATLNLPYSERQHILSPFRDGEEWDLVAHHFYEYTMFAVDTVMGHIESAFNKKHHEDPDCIFWIEGAKRWEHLFKTNEKILKRGNLDRVSLSYRRRVYLLLDRVKEHVIQSQSSKLCKIAIDPIFREIHEVLDDFKIHTNHVLTTAATLSTASLAHMPVSRRSLTSH